MSADSRSVTHHKNSQNKDRGPSVSIPNIPKVIDEKARMKLMTDYEKYEPELFKHHIGTPETTQTIGLKLVAVDFDRRVPTKNEPTLVERDYETRRRHRPPRTGAGTPFSSCQPTASPRSAAGDTATTEAAAAASAKAPVTIPLPPHVLPLDKQAQQQQKQQKQQKQQLQQQASEQTPAAIAASPRRPQQLQPRRPLSSPPRTGRRDEAKAASMREHVMRPASAGKSGEQFTAERCGILLRVLLDPPKEYSESFHIDLRHIDLGWMRTNHFPSTLVTLNNFSSPTQIINSPRTVLTLLRNGVAVADLFLREVRDEDVQLPLDAADVCNEAELRKIAKRTRQERLERRLNRMVERLSSEYASLCQRVSLADIIKSFRVSLEPPADDSAAAVGHVTAAMQDRQERWKQSLVAARRQLERQMSLVRDVRSRQAAAEARQRAAEDEMRAHVARHRDRAQQARHSGRERLAQARARAAEAGAAYAQRLADRQARADERNAQRVDAQRRLAEERRAQREARAAEQLRRAERAAAAHEAAAAQVVQRAAEREARGERRAAAQRRHTVAAHDAAAARAREVQGARAAALARAAQRDAAVREAALEQQRRAGERLAAFAAEREAQHQQRIAKEAACEERRCEVRVQAEIAAAARHEAAAAEAERKESARRGAASRAATERVVRSEGERDAAEEKAFQVLQSRRVVEFEKLESVYRLVVKRATAQARDRQREIVQRETTRRREELMRERDALKLQFAKDATSLTRSHPVM